MTEMEKRQKEAESRHEAEMQRQKTETKKRDRKQQAIQSRMERDMKLGLPRRTQIERTHENHGESNSLKNEMKENGNEREME